jgi:hypothetical protein
MTAAGAEFKRIVGGLHHRAPLESMRCAAELAALLRLELLGLFLKEARLSELAALPFAREFRLPGGWRKVEPEALVQDLDVAAQMAQTPTPSKTLAVPPGPWSPSRPNPETRALRSQPRSPRGHNPT